MKTTHTLILASSFCLALAACGGDAMKTANAALQGKQLAAAEAELDKLAQSHGDLQAVHMERFVLFRYLAVQGEAAKQDAYNKKALGEYGWLVTSYKLAQDYRDMEGSMKSVPEAAAAFAAARKPLYGE